MENLYSKWTFVYTANDEDMSFVVCTTEVRWISNAIFFKSVDFVSLMAIQKDRIFVCSLRKNFHSVVDARAFVTSKRLEALLPKTFMFVGSVHTHTHQLHFISCDERRNERWCIKCTGRKSIVDSNKLQCCRRSISYSQRSTHLLWHLFILYTFWPLRECKRERWTILTFIQTYSTRTYGPRHDKKLKRVLEFFVHYSCSFVAGQRQRLQSFKPFVYIVQSIQSVFLNVFGSSVFSLQ